MWSALKRLLGSTQNEDVADTPVVVATFNGSIEASMVLSQLHDSGIPAAIIGAESAAVFGMQSGILAEVRIVVPAMYVTAAQDLLRELDLSADMTLDDDDALGANDDESDPSITASDDLRS